MARQRDARLLDKVGRPEARTAPQMTKNMAIHLRGVTSSPRKIMAMTATNTG